MGRRVASSFGLGLVEGEGHLDIVRRGRRVENGDDEVARLARLEMGVFRGGELDRHRLAGLVEHLDAQGRRSDHAILDIANRAGDDQG